MVWRFSEVVSALVMVLPFILLSTMFWRWLLENADHPQHSVLSQSSAINVSSSMAASVDHQRTAHETMAEPGAVSVSQGK